MIIKTPVSYDVSHWRPISDFASLNPFPYLVFTKATEAVTGIDETFIPNFADLKQDGIHRGAYHFFRKFYDAAKQAQHFCNTVAPYITDKDILALDVEEGGEKAAQLQTWFEYVQAKFPHNLMMIYSRKNILDPIEMNAAQKEFFKKIKVWTSGYPYHPDAYSSVPVYYIPDQSRWGPVWMWQYTDHGQVEGGGAEGLDCNWVSHELAAYLGPAPSLPPPTEGETMYTCQVKASATPYVNIRQAASATSADIGNVYPGDIFTADRIASGPDNSGNIIQYLHGVNPFIGYVAAQYCDYSVVTDPPPAEKNITKMDITLTAGSTVTTYYSDGTQKVEKA